MLNRRSSAKLCLGLSLAFSSTAFSSTALAQTTVKPRFVVGVDTSGSMAWDLSNNATYGNGVGKPTQAGDDPAMVRDGVFYGCGTGAGLDRDCDGFPNDSKMAVAKRALTNMVNGFGEVEWALAKFHQAPSTCYAQRTYGGSGSCNDQSIGNPEYNTGGTSAGCVGGIPASCQPAIGANPALHNYNAGANCATSGVLGFSTRAVYNGCINYQGGCPAANNIPAGADLIVDFPGLGAFTTLDNRPAMLKWMDNVETNFNTTTTAGNYCSHATTGDCEFEPDGNTPIGSLVSVSGSYLTTVRNADSFKGCRDYGVVVLTDGAETCSTNPWSQAFSLAFPGQTVPACCTSGNNNPPAACASLPTFNPATGVKTYIVGISVAAADVTSLNKIAECGGTTSAYLANSPAQLSAALSDIVSKSLHPEVCNGKDDDCDGTIDEDIPFGVPGGGAGSQTNALFCDGEAHRTAAQNTQVQARGVAPYSTITQSTPIKKTVAPNVNPDQVVCGWVKDDCTRPNEDDDCDGTMDEDGSASFNACGKCPSNVDPCNGVDDDCNGVIDDLMGNKIPLSACPTQCTADVPCGANVGVCKSGVYKCVTTVTNTSCTTNTDCPATAPTCNAGKCSINTLDTSACVGALDCSGLAGSTKPYDASKPCSSSANCPATEPTCLAVAGVGSFCSANCAEFCNGLDDNCDGIVDNPSTLAKTCTLASSIKTGGTSICLPGTQYCANTSTGELADANGYHVDSQGKAVCVGQVLPQDRELCDSVDHDCDGNNFTCTQSTCTVGPQPVGVGTSCGSGIGVCTGTLSCNQTAMPPALVCNAPAGSAEVCNNLDDNCNGSVDENILTSGKDLNGVTGGPTNSFCGSVPMNLDGVGICHAGHYVCTNGIWGCVGAVGPTTEVCNGLDDDCDGLIDAADPSMNDPQIGQKCGTDAGECVAGTVQCVSGAPVCVGAVDCSGLIPGSTQPPGGCTEICDGKDNNCNNQIDEGLDTNAPCGSTEQLNMVGLCKPGVQRCVQLSPGVYGMSCIGGVAPVIEICDGSDNDCDGQTDECSGTGPQDHTSQTYLDCKNDPLGALGAGGGGQCGNPIAPCKPGKNKCVQNFDGQGHAGFVCVGNIDGGPEICNGMDDDCDTKIDEDLDPLADPRLGQPCGQGNVGTCTDAQGHPCGACRLGMNQCMAGNIVCIGNVGPAPYEKCNGADDDCDNKIDECVDPLDTTCPSGSIDPNTPVGTPCGSNVGECKQGQNVCVNGALMCQGFVGAIDEICNGKDDDCDTLIDEGIASGAPCGSSVGECKPGTLVCPANGKGALICQDAVMPVDEVCDGLDNDCDGMVDEGLGLGSSCGSSTGECKPGKLSCVNARTVCSGEVGPQPEVCDCLDNDCDGIVDEDTGSNPICPGSACIMCQCALPCAPHSEFASQCPTGKAPIEDASGCFCVGEQCNPADCQGQTITVNNDVQCTPKSDLVGTCYCKNNVCTFRCSGVQCDNGLICDPTDGRCKMQSCLLPQFRCDAGKSCTLMDNVWQCVDDPCANATCAAEEVCRGGSCFKSCANVTCAAGNLCKDGTCVPDHCAGVMCDPGLVCDPADGKCVAAGACVGTGCPDGQTCDAVKGNCSLDLCLSTHCPYGQKCNSETAQCENRCFGDLLFCDTECVNAQTSRMHCGATGDCQGQNSGAVCSSTQVCSQGKCSDNCANNLINCNGECIDPKTDMSHCGASSDCKSSHAGETCQVGFNCVSARCVAISSGGATGSGSGSASNAGTRVIASGGGGCACSIGVGATGGDGGSSRRGALSGILLLLGLAWLGRRRRASVRALLARGGWAVGLLLLLALLGAGCKVDTFCLDCPNGKGKPGSGQGSAGIAGGNYDGGSSLRDASGGATGRPDGSIKDAGPVKTPDACGKIELCNGLDDDCDGKTDEDVDLAASNIDPKTDVNNCGGCGNVCALDHAFAACSNGGCVLDTTKGNSGCDVGYYNLDGKESNGCEYRCLKTSDDDKLCDLVDNNCNGQVDEDVNLQTDVENCGQCHFRCGFPHAASGATCVDGMCKLDTTKCDAQFADVDGKQANGCEYHCPVFPAVDETCNSIDDDCDGKTDEDVTTATDSRVGVSCGSNVGECKKGTTACVNGLPTCTGGKGPMAEVCDGLDNNCDGNVDTDDINIGVPCGDAPGGICTRGTLQIPSGGCSGGVVQSLVCTGGQGPVTETCNGLDDDCDNQIDEAENGVKPGEGQKCVNGSSGVQILTQDPAQWVPGVTLCKTGATVCTGGTLVCRGEVAPEPFDLCDNKDHDCDGKVLTGFVPDVTGGTTATTGPDQRVGQACGIDTGECSFGIQTCHLDTKTLSCDNQVLPADETCNGKDDNCDGLIDNASSANGTPLTNLPGVGLACVTNSDGTVNTSPPASASQGICQTGTTVCSSGRIGCSGEKGPKPELCDAIDQDCDGNPVDGVATTDPAVGKPCGPPNVGVCKTGVTVCDSSGATPTVTCQGALPSASYVPPAPSGQPESACDGIDNDCDGVVDEGNPAAYDGSTCCDLVGFSCCPGSSGTRQCSAGRIQCVYPNNAVFPTVEVCDNKDNDCDSKVDEGFNTQTDLNNCGSCGNACSFNTGTPHAVLVCSTGSCQIGACQSGYVNADGSYQDGCELQCTVTGNEVCNGKDDDCNGIVDDTPPGGWPDAACIPLEVGVCAADVATIKTYGPYCKSTGPTTAVLACNLQNAVSHSSVAAFTQNYQATETKCDGLDNDCNGKVDEMMTPPIGSPCTKGVGACTTNGQYTCDGSNAFSTASICNAAAPPAGTTETCNGKDDNCDGKIDNFVAPTGNANNPIGNLAVVDLGAATGHTLVMGFEASHPNASASSSGAMNPQTASDPTPVQVCSTNNVAPWASVTWDDANKACCSLNSGGTCPGAGASGWRLCDSSTWQYTCQNATAGTTCTWGYQTTTECSHLSSDASYNKLCLGSEALAAGLITCAGGASQCATVTGSGTFNQCNAPWSAAPVADLSGNLQEWTNTAQAANEYEIRGGSYNDLEGGRTCSFNFSVASGGSGLTVNQGAFAFPDTGFRCCWYPTAPTPACATYDAATLSTLPVSAAADTGLTTSQFTVPATTGVITSVQVLDMTGNVNYFKDLSFTLVGPDNTSVLLVPASDCGGTQSNWAFDLYDTATNAVPNGTAGATSAAFCNSGTNPVGGSVNNAFKPVFALSAFKGKTTSGTWKLQVNDYGNETGSTVGQDRPQITGWKLNICTSSIIVP